MADSLESFLNTTGKLRDSLKMTPQSEIQKTIIDFVIKRKKEAERILKKKGSYSSGALIQSIQPKIKSDKEGLLVEISANYYWKFIDKGVNGIQRRLGSPYSFKNLVVGRDMHKSFKEFIQKKGITDDRGVGYDSLAYALAKGTKKKGIKKTEFMSIAYGDEAMRELSEKLGQDIVAIFYK